MLTQVTNFLYLLANNFRIKLERASSVGKITFSVRKDHLQLPKFTVIVKSDSKTV